ncbi:MAG: glycoside hydrolase family 127 protein [Kiritimatiellales bacterium]|nr:glycoside hydrolase family 127 protein [Kiritimatiellales bacterium]
MHKILSVLIGCSLLLTGCGLIEKAIEDESEEFDLISTIDGPYELMEEWLRNNMREKGLFHYLYFIDKAEYSSGNNAIRQLMGSRLLAELSKEDESWLPIHKKNLDFLFKYWYKEEGDKGYIFYADKSKLGANAMALRTLVYSPYYDEYEDEAQNLAEGIYSLMDDEGSFLPWYKEPDYEYDKERLLYFYSGEAILSLVEYYERSGDERALEMAIRAQDYYIDRYVYQMDKYYYPAYVPWHTLSLNRLYKITGNAAYANAIFVMNDKLLEILDTTNYIGRFYNPQTPQYGTPHSSSDGVYTEGLAYAYEIAILVGDEERRDHYRAALELAVQNLISLQVTREEGNKHDYPVRVVGGMKVSVTRNEVRIDTVQHTMDALRKIVDVVSDQ